MVVAVFFSRLACRTSVCGFLYVLIHSVEDLGDKVTKVETLNRLSKYSQHLNKNRQLF